MCIRTNLGNERGVTCCHSKLGPGCCVLQVVEAGLGHLPFTEKTVTTPTGQQYVGVDFAKRLCGVSIIRSGESMENALRACCKGIKIGKILVHRCLPCLLPFETLRCYQSTGKRT